MQLRAILPVVIAALAAALAVTTAQAQSSSGWGAKPAAPAKPTPAPAPASAGGAGPSVTPKSGGGGWGGATPTPTPAPAASPSPSPAASTGGSGWGAAQPSKPVTAPAPGPQPAPSAKGWGAAPSAPQPTPAPTQPAAGAPPADGSSSPPGWGVAAKSGPGARGGPASRAHAGRSEPVTISRPKTTKEVLVRPEDRPMGVMGKLMGQPEVEHETIEVEMPPRDEASVLPQTEEDYHTLVDRLTRGWHVEREDSIALLVEMGAPSIPFLRGGLKSTDPGIRELCARGLGLIPEVDARVVAPEVEPLLADDDRVVRAEAAAALGRLKANTTATVNALYQEIYHDPRGRNTAAVRNNAAEALRNIGNRSALDALAVDVQNPDDAEVRSDARNAMNTISDQWTPYDPIFSKRGTFVSVLQSAETVEARDIGKLERERLDTLAQQRAEERAAREAKKSSRVTWGGAGKPGAAAPPSARRPASTGRAQTPGSTAPGKPGGASWGGSKPAPATSPAAPEPAGPTPRRSSTAGGKDDEIIHSSDIEGGYRRGFSPERETPAPAEKPYAGRMGASGAAKPKGGSQWGASPPAEGAASGGESAPTIKPRRPVTWGSPESGQ
ncbi:MAG: HEAT repeat domain-containing protein [Planctomycetes bacterium]|nr:HEAT repeat domain-containing protein [Planctomycetota bacterium]